MNILKLSWLTILFVAFILTARQFAPSTAVAHAAPAAQATAAAALPAGTIIAWYSKSGPIPTGWFVCDGSNDTPNLVGKFIMGAPNLAANGTNVGDGKGVVVLPAHHHYLVQGVMSGATLFAGDKTVAVEATTQFPSGANAYTDDGNSVQTVGLTQVPASVTILYLMRK